jgi:hypothetical protein
VGAGAPTPALQLEASVASGDSTYRDEILASVGLSTDFFTALVFEASPDQPIDEVVTEIRDDLWKLFVKQIQSISPMAAALIKRMTVKVGKLAEGKVVIVLHMEEGASDFDMFR